VQRDRTVRRLARTPRGCERRHDGAVDRTDFALGFARNELQHEDTRAARGTLSAHTALHLRASR
jgi:hypothetical protein